MNLVELENRAPANAVFRVYGTGKDCFNGYYKCCEVLFFKPSFLKVNDDGTDFVDVDGSRRKILDYEDFGNKKKHCFLATVAHQDGCILYITYI